MVENSKKRSPGRPRKFDEDEVLDKAIDVFWELGYEASDTETLAKRTGLTKPSLYNAFGVKEDLFVAAINRYRQTRSKASLDAMAKAEAPSEGIRDYFINLANNVASPNHPSGCLIMSIAMPLMDRLPKVAAVLDTAPKESYARMSTYFEEQIEKSNLPKDFDSASAISLIMDLGAAMIMQARAGAPLEALKAKAIRNTDLVLITGQGSLR
ncbi:TetR/AcrR family transcriptional regulator [Falsihalocynthiibacter sp. CO-5D18]|uniref:TetR/AcrR family transcriptional regulator n=1 Tax=Falsihalocynthiibacter sp. CO-5D18 TaxID=3240872 RepID=UPI00350F002F